MINKLVKRGDIFYADLGIVAGCEQGGVRPVIVIQNDIGNRFSPCVIIAAITSQMSKAKLPTHVEISILESGLAKDSVILLEQIRTLDKSRLKEYVGNLHGDARVKLDRALCTSVDLTPYGFDEKIALKRANYINELQDMLYMEEIQKNKSLLNTLVSSIKNQYYDLKEYCDKFNKDVTMYYKPDSNLNNRRLAAM